MDDPGTIYGLVVAGFLLVFFEIFVPGGILGIIGALLIGAGVAAATFEDPAWGMQLLAVSAGLGLVGLYLWLKFFPRSPFGKRMILQNDAKDWHGFDPEQESLVGSEGVSHTPLRPAGVAIFDGRRLDVVTRGERIPANQPVHVINVEGNRVVVTATQEIQGES
ncbi:MAG: hypothetical protein HN849_14390 [Victivallales bacterium]|nr:hypothetical protein [Victivallales bacterium]MBT7165441.1 hypothetical protein [Victivallales bacterium]MBT7300704.1 hypothetical protein [Victivallales bacterium]